MPPIANKIPFGKCLWNNIPLHWLTSQPWNWRQRSLQCCQLCGCFMHKMGTLLEIIPLELEILIFPSKSGKTHFDQSRQKMRWRMIEFPWKLGLGPLVQENTYWFGRKVRFQVRVVSKQLRGIVPKVLVIGTFPSTVRFIRKLRWSS